MSHELYLGMSVLTPSRYRCGLWYPFLAEPVRKQQDGQLKRTTSVETKARVSTGVHHHEKGLNTLLSQVPHQNGVMAYHTLESSTSMRLLKATNLVGR